MLEECQGDKFEELLFCLSSAVLNKVTKQQRRRASRSTIAMQLGLEGDAKEDERGMIGPLILAHQNFLTASLARRRALRERIMRLQSEIRTQQEGIMTKSKRTESTLEKTQTMLSGADIDTRIMKRRVRHNTAGDEQWLNLLLSGNNDAGRDLAIETSFERKWCDSTPEKSLGLDKAPQDALVDMRNRVAEQKLRLKSRRQFQERISKRNEELIVKIPQNTPRKTPRRPPHTSPVKSTRTLASTTRKLPSMKGTGNASSISPTKQSKSNAQLSRESEYQGSSRKATLDSLNPALDVAHPSVLGLRPGNGSTSPLRRTSSLRDAPRSNVATKANESRPMSHRRGISEITPSNRDLPSGAPGTVTCATSNEEHQHLDFGLHRTGSRSRGTHSVEDSSYQTENSPLNNKNFSLFRPDLSTAPPSQYMTMADRTRETLGLKPGASSSQQLPTQLINETSKLSSGENVVATSEPSDAPQPNQASLAERTRMSMAMSNKTNHVPEGNASKNLQRRPTQNKRKPHASSHFPVNPFDASSTTSQLAETPAEPQAARRDTQVEETEQGTFADDAGGSGVRTPSQDASADDFDYASVFKTRSKMRRTPPGSPTPAVGALDLS